MLVKLLIAAMVSATILFVAYTVAMSFSLYVSAPYADEWYSFKLFQHFQANPSFDDLFSFHNEHRIAFPRLLFWAEYAVLGGAGKVSLAVTFLILGLDAVLFCRLAACGRTPGAGGVALMAVMTMLLFSMRQSENFTWAFQTQFVGVFALGSLACAVFARVVERPSPPWRAVSAGGFALGLCFVATFTMANGLLVAPVLVAMALAARLPRRFVVAPAILSVVLLAVYAHGFAGEPGGPPASEYLGHPLRVVVNWCRYVGLFVDTDTGPQAAFGACGLVWAAWIWIRALFGGERRPVPLACLGIAAFAAASGAITAFGRSPERFGDIGASRYLMGTATFWCAMLVHGWCGAAGFAVTVPAGESGNVEVPSPSGRPGRAPGFGPPVAAVLTLAAAIVLVLNVIGSEPGEVAAARGQAYRRTLVKYSLLLGLHDPEANADAGEVDADETARLAPALKARKISLFAGRDAAVLGRPLSEVGREMGFDCPGRLALVATPSIGDGGVRASGTTVVPTRWPSLQRVYVVDAAGLVAGLGVVSPDTSDWRGFALGPPGAKLAAYAMTDGGRLCRIGESLVASAS